MKTADVEMCRSFPTWNLQEETVSPAQPAREQEEFHEVSFCVYYFYFFFFFLTYEFT